jgi:anthranilate synthase/aminodeoxychorismate synthase-like glutamine amidotransferase
MLIIIDNYDSFTYNLVQYLGEITPDIRVYRNDKISVNEIKELKPEGIVISPGPCTPKEAGISVEVVQKIGPDIPILGVCLGHQSIGAAYGGRIIRAPVLMHGKVSDISHDGKTIFSKLPNPFTATRYHSLIIERKTCPDCLEISAETADGLIMGVRHREFRVEGIQFHPESILTTEGKKLLGNFVRSL